MTAFLVVGAVGLVLLLVSLVVGDLFDGALDALAGDAFSGAAIGAFISAFGFGAAAMDAVEAPLVPALAVGVAAGALFGWFATWLARTLKSGGEESLATEDSLGREGTVVTGIPAGGYGVVRVDVGGHTLRLNARSDQELETGTVIYVTGVLSPTAVTVTPVWNSLA